ncbi:hypothetical protein H5410_046894, partial [Solanum commersonii]
NFDAAVTWQSHATPRGSGWKSGNFQILGRVRFESFLRLTCRVFRKDRRVVKVECLTNWEYNWMQHGELFYKYCKDHEIPDK